MRLPLWRGNSARHELAGERADADRLVHVAREELTHHGGLRLHDLIARLAGLPLGEVPISIRGRRQHGERPHPRAMELPAPRALGDLRAFVLRDHTLKLQEQFVFRCARLRPLEEADLRADPRKFVDEQRLVRVASRKAIGRVAEDDRDIDFRGEIPQPLQGRPDQRGPRVPLILKDPARRHLQSRRGGVLAERLRLTRNRLLFLLPRGRHPRIDRCQPHRRLLTASPAVAPARGGCRRARAAPDPGGQRRLPVRPVAPPPPALPVIFTRKSPSACATTPLIVCRVRRECCRMARTSGAASFTVNTILASGTSTVPPLRARST